MKALLFLSNRTRPLRKSFAAVLALVALASLSACAKKDSRAQTAPTVPVTVASAEQKDMPIQITTIGTVEAYSTVQIKPNIGGQITNVYFTQGQDVKKGDLLFTIDKQPLEAALLGAKATLAKDEAQLANARAQEARWTQLQKEGVVAREQAEQIATNAQALEATVNADKAVVEAARVQLQYTNIYAPISGRTGDLMIHAGNLVKANDTPFLVTINQVTPIYVDVSVPEQSLAQVKAAMARGKLPVLVSIPNEPTQQQGTLTFVDNTVDAATGTIKLKATFDNNERKLWPGLFVNTTLTLAIEPGRVVIPAAAIQTGQQGSYVYVVKPDRTAESRTVVVERTLNNEAVLTSGVKPGETVVTDGQLRVNPGVSKLDFKPAGPNTSSRDTVAGGAGKAQPEPGAQANAASAAPAGSEAGAGDVRPSEHPSEPKGPAK